MTRIGPLLLGIALIAGCAGSAQVTEADNRRKIGETDLRVGKEFPIHVRVTSASDRPGMHVHTR